MEPLIVERGLLAGVRPQILNITLADADTEYVFTIPKASRQFMFKTRNPQHPLKFSFDEGMSSSVYMTLNHLGYYEENVFADDLNIYVQSTISNCIIECLIWF